jgi:hypothetical protein
MIFLRVVLIPFKLNGNEGLQFVQDRDCSSIARIVENWNKIKMSICSLSDMK